MATTTVTLTDGSMVYKTRQMDAGQAERFAKMLAANGNFEAVTLSDATAKGKQAVYFRPTGRKAQETLYAAEQDKRTIAAAEQEFIFWKDPDGPGHWCYSVGSGETYRVEAFSCTCPDWVYRCDKAGICCKHQQALDMERRAGRLEIAA